MKAARQLPVASVLPDSSGSRFDIGITGFESEWHDASVERVAMLTGSGQAHICSKCLLPTIKTFAETHPRS